MNKADLIKLLEPFSDDIEITLRHGWDAYDFTAHYIPQETATDGLPASIDLQPSSWLGLDKSNHMFFSCTGRTKHPAVELKIK